MVMHRWFSASSVLTAVCFINFMTAYGRMHYYAALKVTLLQIPVWVDCREKRAQRGELVGDGRIGAGLALRGQ